MKKILIFVCSALLISLNSCSDDNDNIGGGSYSKKKIVKIDELNAQGSVMGIELLSYDSQGRWIKSEKKSDISGTYDASLSYSANNIVFTKIYDAYNIETTTFQVNKNIITSRGTDTELDTYQYFGGYLSRIGSDYADFEYLDGNLSKSIESGIYTITYTEYEDKVGFSIFEADYNDGAISVYANNPLYQFGYLGKKSKNLVKSIKGSYKTNLTYEYTFDNEGYVTEMIELGNYPSYIKYKFYYQ